MVTMHEPRTHKRTGMVQRRLEIKCAHGRKDNKVGKIQTQGKNERPEKRETQTQTSEDGMNTQRRNHGVEEVIPTRDHHKMHYKQGNTVRRKKLKGCPKQRVQEGQV